MKARVKATNRTIQVMNVMDESGNSVWEEISDFSNHPNQYKANELDFIDVPKELNSSNHEPDYWEKLKYQYIGMILAATYSSTMFQDTSKEDLYKNAIFMARELVDKLKEKSHE